MGLGALRPAEAEGRAWVTAFVDTLASPGTLGAQGPAAAVLFPGLRPVAQDGCVTQWSLRDSSAPIVTSQRLELGRLPGEACNQAQFGLLSTTLRWSDGVAPGIMAERLTERFGPAQMHQDPVANGSVTYEWQVLDGTFIHMDQPARPGARAFSLLFMRSLGSPDHLPTEAEGLAWLDRTADLVSGPALVRARGPAAVALVGAKMVARIRDASGCPSTFMDDLLTRGPIESGGTLYLDRPEGRRCEDAVVSSLSLQAWRRGPVTAAALVTRIGARLGAPAVSRQFDRDEVAYRWRTAHGLTVEVVEGLSGGMEQVLRVRAFR